MTESSSASTSPGAAQLLTDKHCLYVKSFSNLWEMWLACNKMMVLLLAMNGDKLNVPKAVEFVLNCKNFDGGFGCTPGNESHAGQVFTCIGALALADALHLVDRDLFCWWLCERQTKSGGLNGRPEKLQDVCYSWWCLSCLSILGRLHWIDQQALTSFVLSCQDPEDGGISDRPDDMADVFHTFFGIGALSLLGYPGLRRIDPAYALPVEVVEQIKQRNSSRAAP